MARNGAHTVLKNSDGARRAAAVARHGGACGRPLGQPRFVAWVRGPCLPGDDLAVPGMPRALQLHAALQHANHAGDRCLHGRAGRNRHGWDGAVQTEAEVAAAPLPDCQPCWKPGGLEDWPTTMEIEHKKRGGRVQRNQAPHAGGGTAK